MYQDVIDKMLQEKLENSKQQGRQEALFDVVKAMFAHGCDVALISSVTELSVLDIKRILD